VLPRSRISTISSELISIRGNSINHSACRQYLQQKIHYREKEKRAEERESQGLTATRGRPRKVGTPDAGRLQVPQNRLPTLLPAMNIGPTDTTRTTNTVPNYPIVTETPWMPSIPRPILIHSDPIAASILNKMGVTGDPVLPTATPVSSRQLSDYFVEVLGSATSAKK
jgi:hypothetical protein